MLKFVFIFVLVQKMVKLACDKGCLKCSSNDECLLCDISHNYFLVGKECLISTFPNCQIRLNNGLCGRCQSGYFLDRSINQCVQVIDSKLVDKCTDYDSQMMCLQCFKDYYINNGQCIPVSHQIQNCVTYDYSGKCIKCAFGYIFDQLNGNCVLSPNVSNCSAYSYVKCKSCSIGYLYNPNLYVENYKANNLLILTAIQKLEAETNSELIPLNICQKIKDPNCLMANNYNSCSICQKGFFLSQQKICQENPKSVIEGCLVYSSFTTCSKCHSGYYLENPTQCSIISFENYILDCTSYNSSASTIQCQSCIPRKYLMQNQCLQRLDSLNIPYCQKLSLTDDACEICDENYRPTTDKKKCLRSTLYCKEYNPSFYFSKSLICRTCEDFYYPMAAQDISLCLPGNIDGCISYYSRTVCQSCNFLEYYLKDGICIKFDPIPNCSIHNQNNFLECRHCSNGYYHYSLVKFSADYTIPNCAKYSLPNVCLKCVDGYFLKENKCTKILDVFPNCQVVSEDSSKCQTCTDGYFLKSNKCESIANTFPNCKIALSNDNKCSICMDGYALKPGFDSSCVLYHDYVLDQCYTPKSDISFSASSDSSCLICKENSIPIKLNFSYGCLRIDYLSTKLISVLIPGCKRYSDGNQPMCLECEGYLYYSETGLPKCVDTCDINTHTVISDTLGSGFNTCSLQSNKKFGLVNCSYAIYMAISGEPVLTCRKYSRGFATVGAFAPISNDASIFIDIQDSTIPKTNGTFLYNGYRIVESRLNAVEAHDDNNDPKQACELYYQFNLDKKYYCARCKWGYSVALIELDNGDLQSSCILINDCDTDISYSGFSSFLSAHLSCHACKGGKSVTIMMGLHFGTPLRLSNLIKNTIAVQCLPTMNFFTGIIPQTIDGCLIYGYIYDTHPQGISYNPNPSIFQNGCVACKPGYTLNALVGICILIPGCDLSKGLMANRCSECSQTDLFGNQQYKAFKDFQVNSCVIVKSPNCLYSGTEKNWNNEYNCRVCKPGYWLNYDNICETIEFPRCADGIGSTYMFPFPSYGVSESFSEYYSIKQLANSNSINGCNTCDSGYIPFRLRDPERQCIYSSYVQSNSYDNTGRMKYIPDCAKYYNNANIYTRPIATCALCKTGKIPTQDGTKCVDEISNCVQAQNTDITKCNICASDYVKIEGACILKNISNCVIYDESPNIQRLSCINCARGFVLHPDQSRCFYGNIVGCQTYSIGDADSCLTCFEDFDFYLNEKEKAFCLKTNPEINSISSVSAYIDRVYQCIDCSNNFTPFTIIQQLNSNTNKKVVQSLCLRHREVDNCISYIDIVESVNEKKVICETCSEKFYLDQTQNICFKRSVFISQCIEYYKNQDKCKTCSQSAIKNDDETQCLDFPSGIAGCATYSDERTCIECYPPRYAYNGSCLLSKIIDKCALYIANYTCASCDQGYFLANSNLCQPAVALNCYSYLAIDKCASCDPTNFKFGLKADSKGIINCVEKELKNCLVSTNVFPFKCLKCNRGFYLSFENECAIAEPINKCLSYDSFGTCDQCEQGFILSADKRSCFELGSATFSDPNCENSMFLQTPECVQCQPGFIFINNTCTSCDINEVSMGCFTCDPLNKLSCLACKPGFYQLPTGQCISWAGQINNLKTANSSTSIIFPLAVKALWIYVLLSL